MLEQLPQLHGAKTAAETVAILEESIPDVKRVYGVLCQYSHPAAHTVFRFSRQEADRQLLTIDPRAGDDTIAELVALSHHIGPALMALGVARCVMLLKVLNSFALPEVNTPWADTVRFDSSDVWRTIQTRLVDPAEPRVPSEDERNRVTSELFAAYEPAKRRQKR